MSGDRHPKWSLWNSFLWKMDATWPV
jgi:hypothetical protein